MYEPSDSDIEYLYSCDDIFSDDNPKLRQLSKKAVVTLYREFSVTFSLHEPGDIDRLSCFGLVDKGAWLIAEDGGMPRLDLFVEYYADTPHHNMVLGAMGVGI